MPRRVEELRDDPFPIKPDTNEYIALSFLVSHREYGYTPVEIANRTEISKANVSEPMTRLHEKGLVRQSNGVYYLEPRRAERLKQRLESLDAAVQLFKSAPDDDAYTEPGWEDQVPSIDPEC